MDSIKEESPTPLREPRNESELLLNQVAEEKEDKALVDILNIKTIVDATDYYAAWGFETDDDDLFLFGVGGPA